MTHNEEFTNNQSKFIISAVALVFCIVWAIIGESDFKIIAVTIAFYAFLKYGVATEASYLASHASH